MLLAVSLGLYATLQNAADVLLAGALLLAITTRAGRDRLRDPVVFLLFVPVAVSALWSYDPQDSARLAMRLLGLLIAVPLLSNRFAAWFPASLLAMALAAALSWAEFRPSSLAPNAFSLAETGLLAIMTGSPLLAAVGMPLIAASKTRSVLGILWIYAGLSGRWRVVLVAALTTALWIWSINSAPQAFNRLTTERIAVDIEQRLDNLEIIDTGKSEAVAQAAGHEPPEEPVHVSPVLGTGAGAYLEATGRQRPHSVPLLLWHELGVFAVPVLAGIGILLWRVGLARAAALVLLWTIWSDSAAADAAGMYGAALLAAHSKVRTRLDLIPKSGGQFYFLRFGTRVLWRALFRFA